MTVGRQRVGLPRSTSGHSYLSLRGYRLAEPTAKELREAALAYHKEGHFVIPIAPDTKAPLIKWRATAKPLTPNAIRGYWRDSDVNAPPDIGLRLDDKTLVIDLDPKNAPDVAKLYPQLMKATRTASTPSGGIHAWYSLDTPIRPRTFTGMDVLTKGRIVVVPPSRLRVWSQRSAVATVRRPEELIDSLLSGAGISKTEGDHLARGLLGSLEPIPKSRRNATLTSIAGILRGAGFRGNRLLATVRGLADYVTEGATDDPMTLDEIVHICESIDWRKPRDFDTNDFLRYEFNTKDSPPVLKWLVEGFLPAEGVTSLFGMGKQGKSYIAMELLRCLTTCTPFLGLPVPSKPVRCLYVDWERRGASLKRRLHALAGSDAINVTVIEPSGSLVKMVEPLRAEVAMGGFEFVIIDSLTIAIMQGNVNDAATVVPAMFALNSLGAPVLALDHTKKPQFTEPYESLSAFGSAFKGNVCSMNWRLKRVSGDADSLQVMIQHVTNNFELAPADIFADIKFQFEEGSVSHVAIERRVMEGVESGLWKYLDLQTGPLEDKEIARVKNMTLPDTRAALSKLVDQGLVERLPDRMFKSLPKEETDDDTD